nr:pre-mRNA-splicing factor SLU7-like [Ipomoea batatas]
MVKALCIGYSVVSRKTGKPLPLRYTFSVVPKTLQSSVAQICINNSLIMATASVAFKSREDHRKQLELEEARKAGLAPAEVDEDGKEINPHIPQYMSSAPWYLNAERPSLKHQRKWKSDPNYTKSWYDRGAKIYQADKYRKGACENCGAMTHNAKSCMERPRKLGAKWTGKSIAPDEKIEQFELDYDDALKVDEAKVDESNQMDFAKVEKRVRTTGGGSTGTVRNLRIREDTAKYLLNLDVNSAYYDPKTRSMREDPLPDMDPNEKFYAGDNQNRLSGQALEFKQLNIHAWESFEKGHDIHMQAAPSQAELLHKNYKINKEKLKSKTKETIMEKYGNAANDEALPRELLLGQSEREVEYDRAGRIVKGQEMSLPKSKYEEDVYINNHTSIWGSWWKDHQWGYKCCKQTIRSSYCTGAAGIEAAEAAGDLMRANIARKEVTEGDAYKSTKEKRLATWGTDVPEDLVLDQSKVTEALKKERFLILLSLYALLACLKFHISQPHSLHNMISLNDLFTSSKLIRFSGGVTPEEMEAYKMKKIHHDDPIKEFLH